MMSSLSRWFRSRRGTIVNRADVRKKTTRKLTLETLEDRTVLSPLASTAWPMYGMNPQHTGDSPSVASQTGNLDWSSSASWDRTVAIGADGLYTNNSAINFDGSLRWLLPPIGIQNVTPALAADGTIYTGSESGLLYAFNANLPGAYVDETHHLVNGLKWTIQLGRSQTSPVIAADGTIFVSALDSYLYAIKPDGTLKWKFKAGAEIESSPALSADGSVVYVGSDDNSLYAVNASTGTLKWKFKANDDVNASPAVDAGGTVYITTSNWLAWAIKPDGKLKWKASIAPLNTSYWARGGPAIDQSAGTVYVGGGDGLYAFSFSGALKWKHVSGARVWSHPAVGADGMVYYTNTNGGTYALQSNGSQVWSANASGEPAIGNDGTVYVGGTQAVLHAFKDGGIGRPTISWLQDSPEPVDRGGTLTLSARGAFDGDGSITRVDFYRDTNGNGTLEVGADELVGADTEAYFGISITVSFPPGTYTYFAQATDDQGKLSNIVSTTNTVAAAPAPQIGSFSANSYSVTVGGSVTLTASNITAASGATITQVNFYVDSNNNGVLDAGDTLLTGTSTYSNGTWTLTFSTTGWATGSYKLFAQALDSYGVLSDPLALDLVVAVEA